MVSVLTMIISSWPTKGGTMTFTPLSRIAQLEGIRRSLTFDNRLCLNDLAGHFLRYGRIQRLGVIELHHDGHAILQERATFAQQLG